MVADDVYSGGVCRVQPNLQTRVRAAVLKEKKRKKEKKVSLSYQKSFSLTFFTFVFPYETLCCEQNERLGLGFLMGPGRKLYLI